MGIGIGYLLFLIWLAVAIYGFTGLSMLIWPVCK
jgi:hypothetical protein